MRLCERDSAKRAWGHRDPANKAWGSETLQTGPGAAGHCKQGLGQCDPPNRAWAAPPWKQSLGAAPATRKPVVISCTHSFRMIRLQIWPGSSRLRKQVLGAVRPCKQGVDSATLQAGCGQCGPANRAWGRATHDEQWAVATISRMSKTPRKKGAGALRAFRQPGYH